jgi:hypothetical protein
MIGECSDYTEAPSDHSPRAMLVQVESLGKGAWAILTAAIVISTFALTLAWTANESARQAKMETRVLQDQLQTARLELAKRGITINTDDHQ